MDLTMMSDELRDRLRALSVTMLEFHHVLDSREPWHYHVIGHGSVDSQVPPELLDRLIVRRRCISCGGYAFVHVHGRHEWGPGLNKDCLTVEISPTGRYWRHGILPTYKANRIGKAWVQRLKAEEKARKRLDADREAGLR